ncbi:hypothetical protein ECG_00504 [Echinococcus granulosus]|uniref:SLAIN motif containing protein 2 n=1 Tax=Echinococcus granulosus TaxID=6210 RepID=U6IXW7_ECHGR|nr:SLAIN motif family, member [Echinococcus granulosus]EUB64497.1 SLAIN motif family, member [Echinococcus granulosus]KAH9286917.1 hypothetical protein ECG_00504 [Echinococcus granulosus]CDS16650.1 SLAIN motif containing protein 2 [Echinococcus granulosus]
MATATTESHEDATCLQGMAVEHHNYYNSDHGASEADTSALLHLQNKQMEDIPEEECWLFKPSKVTGPTASPSNNSCFLWAREVFDSPSSEFYHRRRDLLNRLEFILATEPAKRLPYLGGSVPALNTNLPTVAPTPLAKSRAIGGGSGQNFGPGSSATFIRPKRHASEMVPQHSHQRSSPVGNRSPVPFKTSSGSTDDLQNVADLQSMARKQEDELKAEVAAISAHQQASRMGSSQQSLNSANRSGQESPYNSQSRLNVSSSPLPSDIAKQQMTALRLSLDSQRHASAVHRGDGSEENMIVDGEASVTSPSLRSSLNQMQPPLMDNFPPSGAQQAVIVGRPMGMMVSRLPAPIRRGPRFPSTETLPSFGWGDGLYPGGPMRRSSQEQLAARRIPMPPPRSGSSLSSVGLQQQ